MPEVIEANSIIETKFYRPGLPVDMVHRPRLTNYLKKRQESRPLTLVSAPAGYGKSTLVSCWLEHVDCPTAWLSLEEQDNNLTTFLRYFLAAIQTVFPNKLLETNSLLNSAPLPPVAAIAGTLVNEIDHIGEFFILVLDDYHLIREQIIHDLLNVLLLHPPSNLHLVIATRMDPPLSLVTLRGKGQLVEVRIPSLRFNKEETLLLFKKMTSSTMDEANLAEIDAKSEGWVTGLRLAALAMRHRVGRELFELKLTINNRYVSEYLLSEILAKQAVSLTDCMLKTSIPARFNATLCEELCFPAADSLENGPSEPDFNGEQFLEWLRISNLFIIPLDDEQKWHRYHHIFREFLQQELLRRFGHERIRRLHAVAGYWYARQDLVDEAFYHLLPAGEISAAVKLVAQHRYTLMNHAQWRRLDNWLSLFQDHVIRGSPDLWMIKTWLAYHSGRRNELPALLKQLDTILADRPDKEATGRLDGEIHTLRSLILFHTGDLEGAVFEARKALEQTPPELWTVRSLARLYLSGGLLMTGDKSGSLRAIYGAFEEEKSKSERFKANLLLLVCYIYWISADLRSMQQSAESAITLCLELNHLQILEICQFQLGCVHYQRNDLRAAAELFAGAIARPYQNFGTCYSDCVCGLSMTYQAQGKEVEARQVIEDAIAFLLSTGNSTQLPYILSLQAEIALQQGNLALASQWAEKLNPVLTLRPMSLFIESPLTLVKVWLAQNTPASLAKAGELLAQLQEYLEGTYNTRFLIDTMALQALHQQSLGDQESAQAALVKALRLAQAGGFIRIFVDAGPEMARLFSQLEVDDDLRDYVGKIRAAFPGLRQTQSALRQGELLDPLTDREMQILRLLQKRLSNKEIAAQLVISAGTVKGHTIKIYQKMNVEGRRQAVEKAIALGLLIPN